MTTIAFWEPVLPHHGLTVLFHTLMLARQRGLVVRAQTQVPSAAFDNWCHALDVDDSAPDHGLTLVYHGEGRPKGAKFWVAVLQSDAGLEAALDFADRTPGAGIIVGVERDEPIEVPSYLPVRASAPIPFSHALDHAGRRCVNAWAMSTPGTRALRVATDHILDVVESHRQLADLLTGIFATGDEGVTNATPAQGEAAATVTTSADADPTSELTDDRLDRAAISAAIARRALLHLRAHVAGEAPTREANSILRLPLDRWVHKLAASGLALRCASTSGELAEALRPHVAEVRAAASELRLSKDALEGFFRRPGAAWVLTFVRMAIAAGRADLLDLVDAAELTTPPTLIADFVVALADAQRATTDASEAPAFDASRPRSPSRRPWAVSSERPSAAEILRDAVPRTGKFHAREVSDVRCPSAVENSPPPTSSGRDRRRL